MIKHIIAFIILTKSLMVHAQESFQTERFLNLRLEFKFDYKDSTTNELIKVVKFCQEKINKHFIKATPSTPKLHIFLEGNPPTKDFCNILYFKRKELDTLSEYSILERILSKIIHRTLVGLGSPKNIKAPDWLIAAQVFNIRIHDVLATQEKYPATRYAITNKKYPSLDSILTKSAPRPENYWLYRLYSENCSVFLKSLNKFSSSRQKLLNFLKSYNQSSAVDLLEKHFPELKSKTLRRRWFIKACNEACFDIINPYPPEVITQKVEELFSIASMRPGSNQLKRIPLEKLFENENEALNFAVIAFIEKDFLEILVTAPIVLRPSLNIFLEALHSLKKNQRNDFSKKILVARKEFKMAIEKMNKYISYIDNLEKSEKDQYENYTDSIRAHIQQSKRFQKYFPEWSSYISSLEKKLESTVIK